jgi:hypothetical protein
VHQLRVMLVNRYFGLCINIAGIIAKAGMSATDERVQVQDQDVTSGVMSGKISGVEAVSRSKNST